MSQLGRGLWGLGEDEREVCDRVEAGFATWCLFSLSPTLSFVAQS